MDLVDKQHDLPLRRLHLLQHGLQALLELSPVLRPCDEGAHVEGQQSATLQRLGHISRHDPLGESFSNRGLAHPRLSQQDGVVLGAPREDLDGSSYFIVAPNDRIQLPISSCLREVPAVLLESFIGHLRGARGHLVASPDGGHRCLQLIHPRPDLVEDLLAVAVRVSDAEENVLHTDILVAEFTLKADGFHQTTQCALSQALVRHVGHARQTTQVAIKLLVEAVRINASLCKNSLSQSSGSLVQQRLQ